MNKNNTKKFIRKFFKIAKKINDKHRDTHTYNDNNKNNDLSRVIQHLRTKIFTRAKSSTSNNFGTHNEFTVIGIAKMMNKSNAYKVAKNFIRNKSRIAVFSYVFDICHS